MEDETEVGLAKSRSRRSRSDKSSRFSRLKEARDAKARGEKLELECHADADIYEEVDEEEYSKIVQRRLEDDWIVNDEEDVDGYVDDGREIFDEADEAAEEEEEDGKASGKRKRNANIRKPGQPSAEQIAARNKQRQFMSQFLASKPEAGGKKAAKESATLAGDNNLDDLLKEMKSEVSMPDLPVSKPLSKKKKKKKHEKASAPSSYQPSRALSSAPAQKQSQSSNPFGGDLPKVRKDKSRPFLDTVQAPKVEEDMLEMNEEEPQAEKEEEEEKDFNGKKEPSEALDISDINFDEGMPQDEGGGWSTNSWMDAAPAASSVTIPDTSPMVNSATAGDGSVLRFFWFDAYEDMRLHPGVVYLFGKTQSDKGYLSCCVRLKDIRRRLYFLPRAEKVDLKTGKGCGESVAMDDVKREVEAMLKERFKIFQFKTQVVSKRYAFELPDVPAESEYLEVTYHPSKGALQPNVKGRTFSRVFGTRTSSLEQLILEKGLKGPGWLDIVGAKPITPPLSWCKMEIDVASVDQLSRSTAEGLTSPPLTVLALSIKSVTNSKDFQNEIISVGGLLNPEFYLDKPVTSKLFKSHFTILSHPSDRVLPFDLRDRMTAWGPPYSTVHVEGSERALLGRLLSRLHLLDPDIIVGHDLFSFELDVLTGRLAALKVPHWHRIGRLKRGMNPPKIGGPMRSTWLERTAFAGRVVCDLLISSKELIRARSYDLGALVAQVLKANRPPPIQDLRALFAKSDMLRSLVDFTMNDASFVLRLLNELQVLPLGNQITGICGNLLSRTLVGGRAERNEFLLLHAFTAQNYLPPDKLSQAEQHRLSREDLGGVVEAEGEVGDGKPQQGRRKPAYAGGLVLEPKKGFYDKYILLLDFNSLYPSIIQEYNICFTTVDRRTKSEPALNSQLSVEADLPELPSPALPAGILPTEIRKLVESRRQVKGLMKAPDLSSEQRAQFDIRQKALKITANSMYGCLGFSHSRFFAKPLAALITFKGRDILMKTKELVEEQMNLEVIYGDTDSIMVNSNCTDYDLVFKLGNKIKAEVNKLYRLLELDIDGVFKCMLLLKKKKYAALTISRDAAGNLQTQEELKGLDIVRRDWCRLAVELGEFVIHEILSGRPQDAIINNVHLKIEEYGKGVREKRFPLEKFLITKTLAKNPEEYTDAKGQPHVLVALRHNSRGGRLLRSGDTVEYVICLGAEGGDSGLSFAQRAYSPEEVKAQSALVVDQQYYLAHQLHPVVSRLLEPMADTGAARVAESLGLDASQYHRREAAAAADAAAAGAEAEAAEGEALSWTDCDPLALTCPACGKSVTLTEPPAGPWNCVHCKGQLGTPANCVALLNQLTRQIKSKIAAYYSGWLICEDSGCGHRTRRLPARFKRGHPVCPECCSNLLRPEYSDSRLYRQLLYFRHLFEVKSSKDKLSPDEAVVFSQLRDHVSSFLARSAFAVVDLSKLFATAAAMSKRCHVSNSQPGRAVAVV